jgi:hypothetical protein
MGNRSPIRAAGCRHETVAAPVGVLLCDALPGVVRVEIAAALKIGSERPGLLGDTALVDVGQPRQATVSRRGASRAGGRRTDSPSSGRRRCRRARWRARGSEQLARESGLSQGSDALDRALRPSAVAPAAMPRNVRRITGVAMVYATCPACSIRGARSRRHVGCKPSGAGSEAEQLRRGGFREWGRP